MIWYTGLVTESKRKPNILCSICASPIYRRPGVLQVSKGVAYCGLRCYGKSCRKELPCTVCGTPILSGANKKTCSQACANTNRTGIKYTGARPRDKVFTVRRLKIRMLEIRGGICERCNFSIHQVLEVHHKDRNSNNNDLQNLELICPNCHASEHYL